MGHHGAMPSDTRNPAKRCCLSFNSSRTKWWHVTTQPPSISLTLLEGLVLSQPQGSTRSAKRKTLAVTRWVTVRGLALSMTGLMLACQLKCFELHLWLMLCIYIYMYLEPQWPLFWLEKALFWGGWPSKIRGHLGSRYIYIWYPPKKKTYLRSFFNGIYGVLSPF